MSVLTEPRHAGEFIVSEASGYRSRDAIMLASGAALAAGTVLGRRLFGEVTADAKQGGNTGDGTISAPSRGPGVKVGVYTVRFSAATAFTVRDPDGFVVGSGTTGAEFSDDVVFTITAGGEAFVAGDGFDITVAAGDGAYAAFDPEADDGTNIAAGVLYAAAGSEDAAVRAVAITRDAEVAGAMLTWPQGIQPGDKAAAIAALAGLGIIVR